MFSIALVKRSIRFQNFTSLSRRFSITHHRQCGGNIDFVADCFIDRETQIIEKNIERELSQTGIPWNIKPVLLLPDTLQSIRIAARTSGAGFELHLGDHVNAFIRAIFET